VAVIGTSHRFRPTSVWTSCKRYCDCRRLQQRRAIDARRFSAEGSRRIDRGVRQRGRAAAYMGRCGTPSPSK